MKQKLYFGRLSLTLGLAIVAILVALSGLTPARAAEDIDFQIEAEAPSHVAMGSAFMVRLSYYNYGIHIAPDAWITATLPEGTTFITATDRWDNPLPPVSMEGNDLSWYFTTPICQMPADANCGHVLITMQADGALEEGTALTTTAAVATSGVESDTNNNTASATSIVCEMAGSTKQVQAGLAMPGDVLTYTIMINMANQAGGGTNGRWVVMSDTLPFSHQVRFLGWHGDITGTLFDGHMLQWQGRVEAGEPLTLQYRLGIESGVKPGEVITNTAMLNWAGHRIQLGPVTTIVTHPHGMLAVGPYQGGELWHRHGVSLTVPPGAVTDTTRFQAGPLFTDTHPTPPGDMLFANRAFELTASRFGEPVGQFNAPLTITTHYTDTDVVGLNRESLRLFTRTGPSGPWAEMGEPARVMSGALAFTTTHFSEFALFGKPGEVDLAIDAEAPAHVAAGAAFFVNVSYANVGNAGPSDNWVTVELPGETEFITATNARGETFLPDIQAGNVLTWTLDPLAPHSGRGRIMVKLLADEDLSPGEILTTTALIDTTFEEPNKDNNTVEVAAAILEMAGSRKQVQVQTVMPGDALDYTITMSMAHKLSGGASERWVTLTDTMPFSHQVRFLGWHGALSGTITSTAFLPSQQLRWQGWVQAGDSLQLKYRLGVEGDVIPGEVLTNTAMLTWDGRQLQLGPVTTVVTLPHGMLGVGPYQGGELWHRYGVSLTVPPGAVSDTTRFECHPMGTPNIPPTTITMPPGGLRFANRAFEMKAMRFGEPVGQFNAPLTITVHYTDTDVIGIKRETLRLWTRTGPEGPWAQLGDPVRVMSGSLSFTTTHFSEFALYGESMYDNRVFLPMVTR